MTRIRLPEPGRPFVLIEGDGQSPCDVPGDEAMALFRSHGALLLRGFGNDLDRFRAFAERFCESSVFNESPDRQLLDEAHNIQSVNGGAMAFPLHPELSREPWKPDACFFCCLSPPSAGGETTICDGIEIVRQLPHEVRTGLEGRRLLYVQPATPQVLQYWLGTPTPRDDQLARPPAHCPYAFFRTQTGIARAFTRPALHRPMFADAPAFGNFLLFARFLLGRGNFPVLDDGKPVPEAWLQAIREVAERLTVPIAWRQGDLLMLDNSRFMHGRTAITDTRERLIASYFGYLRNAPRNPEEPADPPWRRAAFRPPLPAAAHRALS